MPVLPTLSARTRDLATDSRIVNSRQLHATAAQTIDAISSNARRILKRVPQLFSRDSYNPAAVCDAGYIPGCYRGENSGPSPGAVVGIVLGSVVGFLLLLGLLYLLSQGGNIMRTTSYQEEVVDTRRRSHSPRSRRSHKSSYSREMRTRSPRANRITRETKIVRDRALPTAVENERVRSTVARETILVDEPPRERRVEGDDVVEVFEEHSELSIPPAPRRQSRRNSSYRRGDYSDI